MFSLTGWLADLAEKAVLRGVARACRRLLGDTPELVPLLEAAGEQDDVPQVERIKTKRNQNAG